MASLNLNYKARQYANGDVLTADDYNSLDETVERIAGVIDNKLEDIPMLSLSELEQILNEVEETKETVDYIRIQIKNFNAVIGSEITDEVEIGNTIHMLTLQWELNGTEPAWIRINGESVNTTSSFKTYSNLSIDKDTEYILTVSDREGAEDSASVMLSFKNRVYYGVDAVPENIDQDFVRGLNSSKLVKDNKLEFTTNATSNDYIWYCCPASFGEPVFTFGSMSGGFTKIATVESVANSYGYSQQYNVYRSDYPGLGLITIKVQ